jgi:adenylyltransferase/sulfurtransferase
MSKIGAKMDDSKLTINYYEEDKDDRTTRFFGKEELEKLQNSNILVVGAGAIGNEVIKNLAMLGVKKVRLVDFDKVSKSNVNRCLFFREEDHNTVFKVDAVKQRVAEMSNMKIIPYNCRIEEAPEEVWENLDLVIVGVDNDYARMLINAKVLTLAMEEKYLPVINGAMALTFIECEVLIPGSTACLCCLWTSDYKEQLIKTQVIKSCDEFFIEVLPKFPAISTFTSVVGGIMVSEATKLLVLTNKEDLKEKIGLGYLIRHDLNDYEYTRGPVMRNAKCSEPFCRGTFDLELYKNLWNKFGKKINIRSK